MLIAAPALLVVTGTILAGTHSNTAAITINDSPAQGQVGPAATYPSTILVGGESTLVGDVNVTLTNFGHGFSDDVDVLLQSPSGAKTILMSDAGDGNPVSGRTLTFDQSAASMLPDESPFASGTYKPTNHGQSAAPFCSEPPTPEPDPDVFPSPAPAGPYTSTLATFSSTAANGTWRLFVVDDCLGDSGSIAGGWSLTIVSTPTAVHVRDLTGRALPGRAELVWRTGSEVELLGFNVYRSDPAREVRVNRNVIGAKGNSRGATYRFVDRRVRAGVSYTYRLQAVELDGSRSWAGLVALRAVG